MATDLRVWLIGARPRTLPAAVVPVVVGTAVALRQGDLVWWRVLAALVVSLAIQVGTNFANDYSDGVRGTDDMRVGPQRLVASGLKPARAVKLAAMASFGVAAVAGLALAATVSWWLIAVGALCFAAGWLYTGGPKPYGYAGLGEVFVFVFFGLVATAGSAYVHLGEVTALALAAAVPVGALATALLVVNNLRDIPTDTAAGKRTLAVRLGEGPTRTLYIVALLVLPAFAAFGIAIRRPFALVALLGLALGVAPARRVLARARGRDLIPVLVRTGQVQLAYGLLLSAGIAAA
ncbi:MAG: 1,4-dihydroxy-2-naphthoate polyprenyltransferase [uncultured Acidimicrobiales bacterium]|uniref:1,4-dihydroxy-2-naphthoate octaprenyltransferase n=1 Tax=uncultured Acidimicrobiales bacterium TaxID=310071 RepID=A0A6J4I674_9ACTN|nr:MAG: 1,4-dihydroxy-2-naphthoate polyprenyltransferase [uncultured Acidimicrobiales bacterium]